MRAADPSEHEQMQRHIDAHLRCAERNPHKREQHLNAARYYAQLLGVEPPSLPLTAESWANANPACFFVIVENQRRRCSLCGKHIAAGEQYFGMREINVRLRSGLYPSISIRKGVGKRLHRACAESIK
jgi:hypothetical protein